MFKKVFFTAATVALIFWAVSKHPLIRVNPELVLQNDVSSVESDTTEILVDSESTPLNQVDIEKNGSVNPVSYFEEGGIPGDNGQYVSLSEIPKKDKPADWPQDHLLHERAPGSIELPENLSKFAPRIEALNKALGFDQDEGGLSAKLYEQFNTELVDLLADNATFEIADQRLSPMLQPSQKAVLRSNLSEFFRDQ